jgi:hypothetical protein
MDLNSLPQSLKDSGEVNASELSKELLDFLLRNSASFTVRAVPDLAAVVQRVENRIEELGMKCRVYTENRAVVAGGVAFTPVGLAGVAAIAVHTVATWNPDYEIGKNPLSNCVSVSCKKPKPREADPGDISVSTSRSWWPF